MKKNVAVALGLAVLSTTAFGSKARLGALGEDVNGTAYISDNRNIFYNPAQVNNFKDMVTFEWGDTAANADGVASPSAEGGFLRQGGNLVYGLHFGAEDAMVSNARTNADTDLPEQMNNWDFFIGGDAGMQWGAGFTYGKFSKTNEDDAANTDTETTSDLLRLRFGITQGDLQVAARLGLTNKAEITDNEVDANSVEVVGKSDMDINAAYHFNDMYFLFDYTAMAFEAENDADTLDKQYKYNSTSVGVAKLQKVNDKARANYKIAYVMDSSKNVNYVEATTAAGADTANNSLAATLGIEVDANSWLTLRGSVQHNVLGNKTSEYEDGEIKETIADSTVVNAGASLMFGELQLDGIIGNQADDASVDGANTAAGNGSLRSDVLMSRVSMTYRF